MRKSLLIFLSGILMIDSLAFFLVYSRIGIISTASAEKTIGMLSILELTLFLVFTRRYSKSLFSVSTLFVLFLHLFNVGVPIVRLLGWIDYEHELILIRRVYLLGDRTYLGFLFYVIILITALEFGVLFYQSRTKQHSSFRENTSIDINLTYHTALTMLGISVLPFAYSEILTLRNSLQYGYQNDADTFSLSGTGIGLMAGFFTLGILLLLCSLYKKKREFNFVFYMTVIYQLFRMFVTGDRSTGIILIFMCVYIRHKLIHPIKVRNGLGYMFVAYLMLLFIKIIELVRHAGGPTVLQAYSAAIQNNLVSGTLNDYGNNVWSALMVFHSVPSTGHFRYGLTYLASIVGKPLDILGITDKIWKYADFSIFLKQPQRGTLINQLTLAMGGSFTGEWYLNFGWIGICLIPIFGYALAAFSDYCDPKKQSLILAGFNIYVATLVIWWVRQYFPSVSWNTMVYGSITYVVYFMWKSRMRHTSNLIAK